MKSIFLKPIGTLRTLGTAREWGEDILATAAVVLLITILSFLLL